MIFYHVSPSIFEKSILKNGLIPMIGDRSCLLECEPKIYLFKTYEDLQDGLSGWLGEELEEFVSVTIYKVYLPKNFKVFPSFHNSESSWEFFTKEKISPKFLEIISRE